jgi:large subunit ribosomal protein L5
LYEAVPENELSEKPAAQDMEEVEKDKIDSATEETQEASPKEEEIKVPEEVVKPRRKLLTEHRSMRDIKIGKVVVNISTGQSGEPLDNAMKILENLTGQRPCTRRAKQTIRTFGIRRNEPISCMVTLRGSRAEDLLVKAFSGIGNRINPRSFDQNGNFAFGIREHIDIPGQRYDPALGITGMDVMATVERLGYRVARKRRGKSRVGRKQKVTREEAIEFIKNSFGVEVGLPSE